MDRINRNQLLNIAQMIGNKDPLGTTLLKSMIVPHFKGILNGRNIVQAIKEAKEEDKINLAIIAGLMGNI